MIWCATQNKKGPKKFLGFSGGGVIKWRGTCIHAVGEKNIQKICLLFLKNTYFSLLFLQDKKFFTSSAYE